jgi:hypothetical protein
MQRGARRLGTRACSVGALAAAVLSLILSAHPTANAAVEQARRGGHGHQLTMFVQGDSIEAIDKRGRYYDDLPGSKRRVWLGAVQDRFHLALHDYAMGGAGFLRQGNSNPRTPQHRRFDCKGQDFLEQLGDPHVLAHVRADDLMAVFGGFNDSERCNSRDEMVKASRSQIQRAVDQYMDRVLDLRTSAGHEAVTTLIGTPFPTGVNHLARRVIVPLVRSAALAHGFVWVNLSRVLNNGNTLDGIHPDYAHGTRDMARAFVKESHFGRRMRALAD